jgi:deazaflavin-dependent oxidoreductase (nitroreductase family)
MRRITRAVWRLLNPLARRLAGRVNWWVLLETTGRRSGEPRRVPLARGPVVARTAWLISDHGSHSAFAQNIVASPRVRLKHRGRWHEGTATLVPLDDAVLQEFPCAKLVTGLVGIEPKLIKVELD